MAVDEKNEILRARVSKATKFDFETIAASFDKSPTDQLRELIEGFIAHQSHRLSDRVAIHIHRPPTYDYGAWRVTIKLRRPEEGLWLGSEIPFPLPNLPKRRISSDPEYLGIVVKEGVPTLGGKFVKGEWRGHVYSNGIPEKENPTPIEEVEIKLRELVTEIIERFAPKHNT